MIDVIGILTRTWLGLASAPLMARPRPARRPRRSRRPRRRSSASDAVQNIQKFYAGIKQVTAQFRQTVKNATFGTEKTSDGTVWLMKPGKMRWDYVEKKRRDGPGQEELHLERQDLYVVEHDNKQVMKKDLKNDLMPVAVTFLYGNGDLDEGVQRRARHDRQVRHEGRRRPQADAEDSRARSTRRSTSSRDRRTSTSRSRSSSTRRTT